jgi:Ca2+-binding RTX toxin-like protein
MGRRLIVMVLVVGGCLVLPVAASGATVSVTEASDSPNRALVDFRADPAEANRLTASVPGESGEFFDLRLLDEAAAIQPGPGCSGGGAVGVAVDCQVRKPVAPIPSFCTKLGCVPAPGTGWKVEMRFALGDGGSHLDAGLIPDFPPTPNGASPRIAITVLPGAGADQVTTAGGDDVIESSPGADTIQTGAGEDTVRGGPTADGADVVDLGLDRNHADYRERTASVIYKANDLADDGGLGEGDRLLNVRDFQAGSGDDLLEGGGVPAFHVLDESLGGGPGADLIIGGAGNDNLWGGPGNDSVFGQEGEDHLYETLVITEGPLSGNDVLDGGAGPDTISASYGDDRVSAGDDQDRVELGPGSDQADAGGGEDLVRGEAGDDTIRGGAGDDRLVGDDGRDVLFGDAGADRLLAGVVVTFLWDRYFIYSGGPLEGVRDSVDCGAGRDDAAGVDRTDQPSGCEDAVRLTRLQLLPATFALRGAAEILYEARVRGWVSISGPGVQPERQHDAAHGEELGARFLVKPVGRAKQTLRRHGRVKLRVTLTLRPDTGGKVVRHRWVRIRRNP